MSDQEIWSRMKSGDKQALSDIYAAHIHSLLRYGNKLCRDESLVEDCIHDLFVEIWNKRTNLGDTDSIIKYLVVSLRHKIFRGLKKSQLTVVTDEPHKFKDEESFYWLDEEDNLDEKSNQLKSALQSLTSKQQEAIYLKYYLGLDYDEICEMLDMKYQSIRNLIHRAISSLRDHLHLWFFIFLFLNEYKSIGIALLK